MENETELPRRNVNISGELHNFIRRKTVEPEYEGETIGSLVERAIRSHFGVDENGEPILKETPKKKLAHPVKE
jgi:hypothetical protein